MSAKGLAEQAIRDVKRAGITRPDLVRMNAACVLCAGYDSRNPADASVRRNASIGRNLIEGPFGPVFSAATGTMSAMQAVAEAWKVDPRAV